MEEDQRERTKKSFLYRCYWCPYPSSMVWSSEGSRDGTRTGVVTVMRFSTLSSCWFVIPGALPPPPSRVLGGVVVVMALGGIEW